MKSRAVRRARRAVLLGLTCFLLGGLAFAVCLDSRNDVRDPEYAGLLDRLRSHPDDRPLVLALGTSRTANGLAPPVTECGSRLFNFGLTGADPVERLVVYERLRRDGVRPDVLLVEVLAAHLTRADGPGLMRLPGRLTAADIVVLDRLTPTARHDWLADRANPWWSHRFGLLSRAAPSWLPWASRLDHLRLREHPNGWLPDRRPLTADDRARGVARARMEYEPALTHFQIAPVQDRATRELLRRCEQDGVRVVLYLMPEGPSFRAMVPTHADARLADWLADVRCKFGVAVIDARHWADEEAFADGHHLRAAGAVAFTTRFLAELAEIGVR